MPMYIKGVILPKNGEGSIELSKEFLIEKSSEVIVTRDPLILEAFKKADTRLVPLAVEDEGESGTIEELSSDSIDRLATVIPEVRKSNAGSKNTDRLDKLEEVIATFKNCEDKNKHLLYS